MPWYIYHPPHSVVLERQTIIICLHDSCTLQSNEPFKTKVNAKQHSGIFLIVAVREGGVKFLEFSPPVLFHSFITRKGLVNVPWRRNGGIKEAACALTFSMWDHYHRSTKPRTAIAWRKGCRLSIFHHRLQFSLGSPTSSRSWHKISQPEGRSCFLGDVFYLFQFDINIPWLVYCLQTS